MNNSKITTSLDNTNELRNLIINNPELPLLIFCGEESHSDEYAYTSADVSSARIEELAYDGEYYVEKSDYKESLEDKYSDNYETESELEHYVQQLMEKEEFLKAIVIYVG